MVSIEKVKKWTVFELQRVKLRTILTNLGQYLKNRKSEKEMIPIKVIAL